MEEPSDPVNTIRLEGTLLKFFVEPVIGAFTIALETDIHIKVAAKTPEGFQAERSFFVKGSSAALMSLESTFQTSVDDATRQIIRDMVEAIVALMNRYPELNVAVMPRPHLSLAALHGAQE